MILSALQGVRVRAKRAARRTRARWRAAGPNTKGAAWILLAAIAITIMSVLVKLIDGRLNPFQITFLRTGMLVLVLPLLFRRFDLSGLRAPRPFLLIVRSIMATVSISLAYVAIARLPLADAQAITFASTLFLVPLAALLLGESIGVRRWSAAIVGFLGVLIVLRPSGDMNIGALAALASAFLFAATITAVTLLSRVMPTTAVFLYGTVLMCLFSAIPAFVYWTPPTPREWGLLFAIACVGAVSQYSAVRGFSTGEASAIGPVDYTRLIFATAAGVIWFDERPDIWTGLGAAVIVGSTLYISWREAQRGAKSKVNADA
ncbi:MAG: DMT family transporter [Pseudomonadota bacterium]